MTKDAERSTKASVAASRTPENSVNVKFAEILLCVSRVNATKAEPQATLAVAPFGLGPYRLLPGVLSNKANTKSTIPPSRDERRERPKGAERHKPPRDRVGKDEERDDRVSLHRAQ
jgi:hypothetical protein